MSKPEKKIDIIEYILSTPIEDILAGTEVTFAGETELERMTSMSKFTTLRGIAQKYARSVVGASGLTPDENSTIIKIMKACVVQKTSE